MRVIKSEPITILNTNVPETEPEWVAGTTYEQAAVVRYNHRVYKSIVAGNQGNQPDVSPASWMDQGATNPYRCIDEYVNSATEHSSIEMTLLASRVGHVVFFGLSGTDLELTFKDASGQVVSDQRINLMRYLSGGRYAVSWSEYFFGRKVRTATCISQLPFVGAATLGIRITDAGGLPCRCSNIVLGYAQQIGATQFGLALSLEDYSKKTTDEFGRTFLRPGESVSVADCDLCIHPGQMDAVVRVMNSLRGRAACWLLENESPARHQSTTIYGFWDSFNMVLEGPGGYKYNMRIKGLI